MADLYTLQGPMPKGGSVTATASIQATPETPMKRPAQPVEVAPLYVLPASQESSYITGEVYGATGGLEIS